MNTTRTIEFSGTNVMQVLRAATAEHHRRAERHEFQREFVRGRIPLSIYHTWLSQMHHVHESLELRLEALVLERRELASVFGIERRKLPKIVDDLAFLDSSEPASGPVPATQRFVVYLQALAQTDPVALLGAFYVMEGSTNGSRFIAPSVRKAYDLPDDGRGTSYLDSYGDRQPNMWQQFKVAMNDLALGETEVGSIVTAACNTFDGVTAIGEAFVGRGNR